MTRLVAEHPVLWGGPGALETLTCCGATQEFQIFPPR